MLSSIQNSEQAIIVNIRIIRIFVKMRELLLSQKEIIAQLREIAERVENHDENIILIFDNLKQLEQSRQQK